MELFSGSAARAAGPVERHNLGNTGTQTLFVTSGALYVLIYSFEAPIRYLLYLWGRDSAILARDALIILPITVLAVTQAMRLRLHPAICIFALMLAFHGLVLFGTIGSPAGIAYGGKVLINLLFGFLAGSLLIKPGPRLLKLFALLWFLTLVGVVLDKFLVSFPWVGIKTLVGNVMVDVSKDWQIQDELSRRVAGFTRSSISVAVLVPALAIILMGQARSVSVRAVLGLLSLGAVLLTTQKGSLIAFAPVAALLMVRPAATRPMLQAWTVIALMVTAGLPLLTAGIHLGHGSGVFSAESLYLRIADTWPHAWQWIERHQMPAFGVGLGGIGGAQRVYAPDNFNPADNFFILLYAYFGLFALLYLAAICWLVLAVRREGQPGEITAIAFIAFAFGYGAVLSVVEDQIACLFLGAATGVLWRAARQQGNAAAPAPSFMAIRQPSAQPP